MADRDLRIIEEHPVEGRRLGRVINHDPRNRNYPVKALLAPAPMPTSGSHHWPRYGEVLEQGDLGSCTANATIGMCMTSPHYKRGRHLHEQDAVDLYSRATELDPFPGSYPPEDTGSSGVAALQAARERGLITEYRWAFGFEEALAALHTLGPVIVGTNWYSSMDEPNSLGLVHAGGEIRGGHEYEVIGVNFSTRRVRAINSWGPNWGQKGRFWITFDDFDRLLTEDGDVAMAVKA